MAKESNKNFAILQKELEKIEAQLVEVRQNFLQAQKNYRNCQTDLARGIALEKNLKTDIEVNFIYLFLNSFFYLDSLKKY